MSKNNFRPFFFASLHHFLPFSFELKRLRETLEIRNNRIIQLEAQVGHSSNLFAARGSTGEVTEENLRTLADKVDQMTIKLERMQATHPSNSIVINSCHPSLSHQKKHSSVQTDPATEAADPHLDTQLFSCETCSYLCSSEVDLQKHVSDEHNEMSSEVQNTL